MRAGTLSGTSNSGTILNVGTPDFSTGHRSRSTTSTWNSRSQCELTANPLSGKLGADQGPRPIRPAHRAGTHQKGQPRRAAPEHPQHQRHETATMPSPHRQGAAANENPRRTTSPYPPSAPPMPPTRPFHRNPERRLTTGWGAPRLPDSPSIRMDVWKGEVIASTEEELLSRIPG